MMQRLTAFFLALGLAACSGLPLNAVAPTVSVAEVKLRSLGLFEQHFDVGLRVNNPNDFDLNIEALDFELEVNGQPFAHGLSHAATLIPAMSSTVLWIDAIVQSNKLIRQIKALPPETLKEGVAYRMTGHIKLDKSSRWLPFDHAGTLGGDGKKTRDRPV